MCGIFIAGTIEDSLCDTCRDEIEAIEHEAENMDDIDFDIY